jgi:hypothetical protein
LVEDLGVSCVSTSHVCGNVCELVGEFGRVVSLWIEKNKCV